MSFISFYFALFFTLFFFVYWLINRFSLRFQNAFLLLASYFFYAFWSWKFLLLLFAISLGNYLIGIAIGRTEKKIDRRAWLIAGLVINLGNLIVFKYFNFFVEEFVAFCSFLDIAVQKVSLSLIVPLGISFYTFLSVSYLVDIYRRTINPEQNPVNVLLTLSFFPIIFSGPIQRPSMLLPEIKRARVFDYANMVLGLRQILWGLVTKLVIADNLAPVVNKIFEDPGSQDGATVLLGILFFTVQIYADFSAYSDIAIGLGRLLGFDLMRNFAFPYFAGNIGEFWKRWHISLTTWFRDYLFLPMVYAVSKRIRSEYVLFIKSDYIIYSIGISVTWFITGIWHGARSTFLIWGLIHGFFLILYQVQKKPRKRLFRFLKLGHDNPIVLWTESILTLVVVAFAWVFFRADSIEGAMVMINKVFTSSVFQFPLQLMKQLTNTYLILMFFILEWYGRGNRFAIEKTGIHWPRIFRWAFYTLFICFIFLFAQTQSTEFLYFKF